MTRAQINRWAGLLPVAMSLGALAIVATVVFTGWERHLSDEGAAAHLFQLLIAGEIPLIALFLMTAERGRAAFVLRLLAAQGGALLLALAPVAYYHL